MLHYTDKDLIFIKEYYPEKGPKYCSERLKISIPSIIRKAREMGLFISDEKRKQIHRKAINEYNESIGREIFNPEQFISKYTPEAIYSLGLIWADGCMIRKEVRFSNQIDDAIIFYKILLKTGCWKMFKYECKNHSTWKKIGRITASSPELHKYLIDMKYNESPEKIINSLPQNIKHYWFRGIIDGDGCWYIGKDGTSRRFTLAGPYEENWIYFTTLLDKLNIGYKICRNINKCGKNSTVCIYKKDDIKKLGEYVYNGFENDKIGLNRKYEKYIKLIAPPESRKCKSVKADG